MDYFGDDGTSNVPLFPNYNSANQFIETLTLQPDNCKYFEFAIVNENDDLNSKRK
jgi:hypothetical protein